VKKKPGKEVRQDSTTKGKGRCEKMLKKPGRKIEFVR